MHVKSYPAFEALIPPKEKKKKKFPQNLFPRNPNLYSPPFFLSLFISFLLFLLFVLSFFLSFFVSFFVSFFCFFFFFIKGCTRGKSSKKREMVINKSLQAMVVENSVQEDSFFFSGKEKFGLFLRGCFFFRKMGHAKQLLLFFLKKKMAPCQKL